MPLTFGSLFAGIGGADLGLERAGLECRWQVEQSEFCRRVLHKHWPTVRKHDDVRTFPPRSIEFGYSWRGAPTGPFTPDTRRDVTRERWLVDLIFGGDPCQANSAAVGAGVSGHASLGGEFIRIVDVLRPRLVVRENPTHARKDAPWPWWRFRSELERLGYAVLPFRLRACCFGAFHQRDRMFLLGELADTNRQRLEGREAKAESRQPGESPRRVHAEDWLALSASRGLRSRRGLADYVDRIKAAGNCVHPAVAEFIGRRLIESV